MALNKIELKLGKKVISLTPAEFEELKSDMHLLDKGHHYYWHSQPYWVQNPSYGGITTYRSGSPAVELQNAAITGTNVSNTTPEHPAFSGSILSTS